MKLFFFAAALLFVTVSGARAQDQATVVASCGTASLKAGTQAFRTVDVNGVTCSGAGSVVATSVWSASDAAANGMTLSNGGLTVTPSGATSWQSVRGSTGKTSGKLYVEFANSVTHTSLYTTVMGLASAGFNSNNYIGFSNYSGGMQASTANDVSAGFTSNYVPSLTNHSAANDVWGLAIDFAAGSIWLANNNVWANGSNPATGSLPVLSFVPATVGALFPGLSFNSPGSGVWTLQPTAASQKYAPPAGFSPWN